MVWGQSWLRIRFPACPGASWVAIPTGDPCQDWPSRSSKCGTVFSLSKPARGRISSPFLSGLLPTKPRTRLLVDLTGKPGGAFPGELTRASQGAFPYRGGEFGARRQLRQRARQFPRRIGVDRRIARCFFDSMRGDDGRAALHGFQNRQSKSLVERRVDESEGARIQRGQFGIGDFARQTQTGLRGNLGKSARRRPASTRSTA